MERTFFSPADVNAFFHESYELHNKGQLEEAEQRYNGLLNIDIDNVTLLFLLGTLYMQQSKNGLAINLLSRAIEKKPDMGEAYVNRGCCYRREFIQDKAMLDFKKGLELMGDNAFVYSNIGSLAVNTGEPVMGMEYVDKAIALEPNNAQAHWNRALLLLEQGRFKEGFAEYEYGKTSGDRLVRNYAKEGETPWWDGVTPGQHLVVYGEQGLGDEILFSSCLPDLMTRCEKIYFETNPRLATLFQRSFPQVEVYGTRKQDFIDWPAGKRIDARVALGDLPRFFRQSLDDFPKHQGYLISDHDRGFDFRVRLSKLGARPKVGLAWAGGIKRTNVDQRSLNLFLMLPILTQNVEWISLQYTENAEPHIDKLTRDTGVVIHHWPDAVGREEYDPTAALINELDLVITVNTSVAHLAGALNVPTWVLTPKAKAWRYWSPDGVHSPWYPRWRLYQQVDDWAPVIEAVAHDLAHWIEKRQAA